MKTILKSVQYRLLMFLKENKATTPFIIIVLYQSVMYSIKPLGIVDSFCIAGYLVFFFMTCIGFCIENGENEVLEQIQLLRIRSNVGYCFSKTLNLLVIGFGLNTLCMILPIFINVINHNELFYRQLTIFDIINAIFLLTGCTFLGGELGSLFNTHTFVDKKLSLALCFLAVLLIVIKVPLYQEVPFFNLIGWVIPPLSKMSVVYAGTDIFSLPLTITLFFSMIMYGFAIGAIRTFFFVRRKF